MEKQEEILSETLTQEFTVTRVLDAPRELVFKAWTEPERLARWWGPRGAAIHVASLDPRPGGTFHYSLQFGDGPAMWGKFVYHEITSPDQLVYASSFSDEAANLTRAPFSIEWPLEVWNTLALTEEAGKTTLTLQSTPANATAEEQQTFASAHQALQQGFSGTLDQLADYLATVQREENKTITKANKTMLTVNPYLNFNGNTEEAFLFYRSVFGGEFLALQRFKDTPEAGRLPESEQDKIMHVALPIGNGNILMATDALESMGHSLKEGNNFSLSLSTGSKAEADALFGKLSAGGQVTMPMENTFWGSYFGMLTDKFGIQWMVSYDEQQGE